MCACKWRQGATQQLQTQGFVSIIPRQTYLNEATYGDFRFYRCINPKKVEDALRTVRIDNVTTLADKVRTDQDVKKLAWYADTGGDMQKWGISIKKLLQSIRFDQPELDNATCRVAFANDPIKK